MIPRHQWYKFIWSFFWNTSGVFYVSVEKSIQFFSFLQAGCVHFTNLPPIPHCDLKVLILLYTPDKRAYLGFIPNDQTGFVDRLRKVIQQQKTTNALNRQVIHIKQELKYYKYIRIYLKYNKSITFRLEAKPANLLQDLQW